MKGYKGMNKDMTCRGMQFEVGKSYHEAGDIIACKHGIHFCEKLHGTFKYYDKEDSRFFEVEASGTIAIEGDKSATSDIVIIRELSSVEVNRCFYGYGYGDGDGYGDGYGYGYGDGNGNGNGNGYGDGDGYGNGNGNGNGYGDGDGYGNGNGNGNGDGDGDGDGIQKILLFI